MPVLQLPACARYAACDVVANPPPSSPEQSSTRRCTRRARFSIELDERSSVSACPQHVQMASITIAWDASRLG